MIDIDSKTFLAPSWSANLPIRGTNKAPAKVNMPAAIPAIENEFCNLEIVKTSATGADPNEILPKVPNPKVDLACGVFNIDE